MALIFLQVGQEAKFPRNPSLGHCCDDMNVCIGFCHEFLFSVLTFKQVQLHHEKDSPPLKMYWLLLISYK